MSFEKENPNTQKTCESQFSNAHDRTRHLMNWSNYYFRGSISTLELIDSAAELISWPNYIREPKAFIQPWMHSSFFSCLFTIRVSYKYQCWLANGALLARKQEINPKRSIRHFLELIKLLSGRRVMGGHYAERGNSQRIYPKHISRSLTKCPLSQHENPIYFNQCWR